MHGAAFLHANTSLDPGDEADFKGGLQTLIGMPSGLDAKQWESAIRREHCDVDAGREDSKVWGASYRAWTTGNYKLATCPRAEFLWVAELQWRGKDASFAPGAFTRGDATEVITLRRRAVSIDVLCRDAPALFLACMQGEHRMLLAGLCLYKESSAPYKHEPLQNMLKYR